MKFLVLTLTIEVGRRNSRGRAGRDIREDQSMLRRTFAGTVTSAALGACASGHTAARSGKMEADWEAGAHGRDVVISLPTPVRGDFALGVRIAPEPWQAVKG
jgi:hypothetical protein